VKSGAHSSENSLSINSRKLTMHRFAPLPLALAFCLSGAAAIAQTAPAAKPAPKPATPREEAKSEAKGLALGLETAETVSANQLDIAARVLTGKAECEFNQTVDVDPVDGKPGLFRVRFKSQSYVMVPEETTTGAVRLVDRKAAVVWLQIPVKSMLLDNREGHRLVDACMQSEQRAAVAAAKGAAANAAAIAATPKK
jgi:hypothetical protein